MAHHKRKKCKRQVRCTMCTQHRWKGNSRKANEGRRPLQDYRNMQEVE